MLCRKANDCICGGVLGEIAEGRHQMLKAYWLDAEIQNWMNAEQVAGLIVLGCGLLHYGGSGEEHKLRNQLQKLSEGGAQ